MDRIRIGTRGSRLALVQAQMVQRALQTADAGIRTELVILQTKGDQVQDKPLSMIGDKGVFASALEEALLEDRIDLAVHSAKDLPMRTAKGLDVCSALPRADARDVLVVPKGTLPPQKGHAFVLGTGSKRRQLQAQACWPGVTCKLIRGNVDTRLAKLADGLFDGILLAKAGMDRMGICADEDVRFDFYPLSGEEFLPAACQGIIAVEMRRADIAGKLAEQICDAGTELEFCTEREVLRLLGTSCSEAAAAWCRRQADGLCLDVMYGGRRACVRMAEQSHRAGLLAAQKATEQVRTG